jgi:hypothetical protein
MGGEGDEGAATWVFAYTSRYTGSLEELPAVLEAIARVSTRNNEANDVTGALLYDRGRFVQVLEGTHEALRALLGRLEHDPRHDELKVLLLQPVSARTTDGWHLQVSDLDSLDGVSGEMLVRFRDAYASNFKLLASDFLGMIRLLLEASRGRSGRREVSAS